MSTIIDIKSIEEIKDYKFSIPNYQRGYRWTEQQVKELLDDIWEFAQKDGNLSTYCIQPLVVCEKVVDSDNFVAEIKKLNDKKEICEFVDSHRYQSWEVIDGQQRLTTISIIIQMICKELPYSITYDTIPQNGNKVNNIASLEDNDAESDINFHFMQVAKNTTEKWLEGKGDDVKKTMLNTILQRVKFIWYQTDEERPISVFTRLNVGRIALTSSELIKALFLNRENFRGNHEDITRAKQTEIAQEWDKIENSLQNDEFWLFLRNLNNKHQDSWNKPTRIDFLLDFLCDKDVCGTLNNGNGQNYCLTYADSIVGNDKYRTFRIYYECYKNDKNKFLGLWSYIKEVFDIWQEWYNNSELYHYVGYLLTTNGQPLKELIKIWLGSTKQKFIQEIKHKIKDRIKDCKDLDRVYVNDNGDNKRQCVPLLLLHNVETIVQQNRVLTTNEQYKLGIFHKFPFHLYKIEHWDVEHIDSATENDLSDDNAQRNWILSAYQYLDEDQKNKIKDKLNEFFNEEKNTDENSNIGGFGEIYKELSQILQIEQNGDREDWKNKVQNYVLLDSSTNRNYKNAIFPDKRSHIVGKEKGRHKIAYWDKQNMEIAVKEEAFNSAFVPVCTKNVFQKTYSVMPGNPTVWSEADSNDYKKELQETLKEFLQQ